MPSWRRNLSNTMNNQGNKAAQEENLKSPENKLKYMEICDLNDRKLKIAVLKTFD